MGKSLKYFMRDNAEEIISVPGPDTFRDENDKVINFEIKVLNSAAIQKINDNYRQKTIATDKKGNPYINNGEVVFKTERDNSRALRHIIAEALVYPDLKDPELMKHYNCVDITEMPQHVFSKASEFNHVSNMVMVALGMIDGATDEAELDDAKNL